MKINLGSEKDIEDERYIYGLFKNKLKKDVLKEFNKKLKILGVFDKYLK